MSLCFPSYLFVYRSNCLHGCQYLHLTAFPFSSAASTLSLLFVPLFVHVHICLFISQFLCIPSYLSESLYWCISEFLPVSPCVSFPSCCQSPLLHFTSSRKVYIKFAAPASMASFTLAPRSSHLGHTWTPLRSTSHTCQ